MRLIIHCSEDHASEFGTDVNIRNGPSALVSNRGPRLLDVAASIVLFISITQKHPAIAWLRGSRVRHEVAVDHVMPPAGCEAAGQDDSRSAAIAARDGDESRRRRIKKSEIQSFRILR